MIIQENGSVRLRCGQTDLWDVRSQKIEVIYANRDRSIGGKAVFGQWQVLQAEEDRCSLVCKQLLENLQVELELRVQYTVKENQIEQEIFCFQNNISSLYIGLTQDITCPGARQLWSFDAVNNQERCIYGSWGKQAFPAAGMLLDTGAVFGVLMDTGTANEWSRWHLRRTGGGNAPAVTAYDPVLMEALEAAPGIRLRAGQYYPTYDVPLEMEGDGSAAALGRKDYGYLLEFDCKAAPGTLSVSAGETCVLELALSEPGRQTVMLPACEQNTVLTADWQPAEALVPLGLFEQKQEARPWHRLDQGREKSYRYFMFVDRFQPTLRNIRKYSQLYLAQALGFSGSTAEKILYADFRMLNWIAEPGSRRPLCVPSIDYFEMYFRDVFWSVNGVEDADLNEQVLDMVASTMDERGWVDNIITPYFGSREKVDNEINYLYVIWSYLNQKRFGSKPDLQRLSRVVKLVMERYDPNRTGSIKTNNPQSLMDVMWQRAPCSFAVSQGYYALTMKTALAFGLSGMEPAYVEKTAQAYRGYYRKDSRGRKYLQTFIGNGLGPGGSDLEMISCLDLEPEFLSLYLFGESLLGRDIVVNTLQEIPVYGGCLMPILARADGGFFTRECNPFNGNHFWEAGRYANGGSYLRPQYIVLAVGKYHGWEPADVMMEQRLRAEFETCTDAPVSMEYLHTLGEPEKSSSHKVFAWNVFVNQINRWIRETMDPDFQVGNEIL